MLASYGHSLLAAALLFLVTSSTLSNKAYGQSGAQGGQTQVASAMSDLAHAQAAVDRLKDRAERALSHDKNWTASKAAVTAAEKNRDAVREQVKQQTIAKPEYQALAKVMEQNSSEAQTSDARIKMANMVFTDQQNSPECAEAKASLNEAKADLDARWNDYESHVLANDPDWKSAIAARDNARAQVSAALGTQRSGTGRTASSSSSGRSSGYGRSSGRSSGSSGRSSSSGYGRSSRY